MASEYVDRAFVFVAASRLTQGNNAAKNWDPDTGGALTFGGVRCSASGALPVTWYVCNTGVTPAMQTQISGFKSSNTTNCKLYYESQGWTWTSAIADAGLKVIQPAVP